MKILSFLVLQFSSQKNGFDYLKYVYSYPLQIKLAFSFQ